MSSHPGASLARKVIFDQASSDPYTRVSVGIKKTASRGESGREVPTVDTDIAAAVCDCLTHIVTISGNVATTMVSGGRPFRSTAQLCTPRYSFTVKHRLPMAYRSDGTHESLHDHRVYSRLQFQSRHDLRIPAAAIERLPSHCLFPSALNNSNPLETVFMYRSRIPPPRSAMLRIMVVPSLTIALPEAWKQPPFLPAIFSVQLILLKTIVPSASHPSTCLIFEEWDSIHV